MNKQLIYQILDDLANEAIPTNGNPWGAVQRRLSAKNGLSASRKTKKITVWTAVRGTLAFFIIVLAMMVSLPQGRVWAQQILHFFIRNTDQITLPTPMPVNLVNVTPGTIQPTLTPMSASDQGFDFYDSCGGLPAPYCSGEQIRKMVDFPVKGFADLPIGMQFIGATGGSEGVTLVYQFGEPYSVIVLLQEGPATDAAKQAIPVGSSATVEEVRINDSTGEYVKGSYFHYAGDATAIWNPDVNLQSLRWEDDSVLYTITMMGTADLQSIKLDKTGLINLAASLTEEVELPTKKSITEKTGSVAEVEKEAGFQIKEPEWLPEGLQLEQASYLADQKAVCLEYQYPVDQHTDAMPDTSVSILESVVTPPPDLTDLIFSNLLPDQAALYKSYLNVGGALSGTGLYAYGSIDGSRICGSRLQNQILEVQMEGLNITLLAKKSGPFSSALRDWLTKQEMIRLAESITGIHTVTEDQIDPEFLTSEEAIKQITQFPLKFATILPEGMNFFYAQFEQDGSQQEAVIYYSDGNQVIDIKQIKGSTDTLEKLIKQNPEIYHEVTVHDQPAILSQGYWGAEEDKWKDFPDGGDGSASVIWFEDGIEYIVGGFNAYPSEIWLEIAGSLK